MTTAIDAIPFALALLVGMLACLEIGWRSARRRATAIRTDAPAGIGAVEGAVFALFGLLLAFAFSGATDRFDQRRALIVQEANAIGTAYLRVDLLPPATQAPIRELFRQYVRARLDTYHRVGEALPTDEPFLRSQRLQGEIWRAAQAALGAANTPTLMGMVLPPLNDMFDITTTRLAASQAHPPHVIYGMLFALALVASLLAGHGMGASERRPWLHIGAFAIIVTVTVYVTLDIESPRRGLIRLHNADQLLVDTLKAMR